MAAWEAELMTDAPDRQALLQQWVRDGAARPMVWGTCDCAMWVADWCVLVTGRDPAAAWRGRYDSERGYLRMIARLPGGLIGMADRGAASVGIRQIDPAAARPGDVGAIRGRHRGRDVVALAIRGQQSWISKSLRGVARHLPNAAVTAWEI